MRVMIFIAVLLSLLVSQEKQSRPQSLSTYPPSAEETPKQSVRTAGTSLATLSARGPSIPASFDANDFSMFYIVRGNWPVVLRYELAEGKATLEIKLQRGAPVLVELPATGKGDPGKISLRLPSGIGDAPQIAHLYLTNRGPANLILHALGCGGRALVAMEGFHRDKAVVENRNHFQPWHTASDEVAIAGIVLSPSDVLNASQGAQLAFSFTSANDFPMWSATFQRQVRESGSRWEVERVLPFVNDPINQGQTKKNSWDGRNGKGQIVGGRYKVMVNAWTSAAQDGSALTSFSSPAFTVK